MATARHDASSSAVGYIYQVKWALLELLRADRPDLEISLERLEDVAWEENGTPAELLQLKHHTAAAGPLGDMADDLWRTLAAWLDADGAAVEGPDLYLITTQRAAAASALEALRPPNRELDTADRLLAAAAQNSESVRTRTARQRFLALPEATRARFVSRIHVLDSAPRVEEIDAAVRSELRRLLPRGHEDTFLNLLWASWYAIALDMLQGRRRAIRGTTIDAYLSELRDDFTQADLPTLVGPMTEDEEAELAAEHAARTFVQQMRWVRTPEILLQKAIVDYYRATIQTRRWVEDDLIGLHELERFEQRLRDEWQREFAWRIAEVPPDADEEQKAQVGRDLLRDILNQTRVRVRERYDDPFFARGKYHELADNSLVGWHPDFEERIADLLLRGAS